MNTKRDRPQGRQEKDYPGSLQTVQDLIRVSIEFLIVLNIYLKTALNFSQAESKINVCRKYIA